MYIFLEVLQGPEKGRVFRLKPHMRLGSGPYEIQLGDTNIPEFHSQILLDQNDQLVLVCNNAVYEIHIDHKIVKKLTLRHATQFQVGDTLLKVLHEAVDRPEAFERDPSKSNHFPTLGSTLSPPPSVSPEITERFLLDLKSLYQAAKPQNSMARFRLFRSPLTLRVLSGPQADDEFFLSWGPREFGPGSLEFPIEYPPLPNTLFTLEPNPKGEALFITKNLEIASVVGKQNFSCILDDGDQIIAGTSVLLIEYVKGF